MNKNIVIITLLIVIFIASAYVFIEKNTSKNRQEIIHDKGSVVMPFDLNKTTHIFKQTEEGGIQQVISKDLNDAEQIELIREHLQKEAIDFSDGNFEDPALLHGENMPGLDVLRNTSDEFIVEYSVIEGGAQIMYYSENDEVLDAIHMWFMAQLMDHGSDASDNMMN